MKTYRTRPIDPHEEEVFLRRANECWELALIAEKQGKWSGCIINVIHSVISLADLMCARFAAKRYAGTSHDEAISYYESLKLDGAEFSSSVRRLGQILSIKTQAEYDGKPVSESETRLMLKTAGRFREYVVRQVGKAK